MMIFGKTLFLQIGVAVAILVVGAFGVLYIQKSLLQRELAETRAQLEEVTGQLAAQQEISNALQTQLEEERRTSRIVENVIREIEASPNADQLVPTDIANAWASGIDSLRADLPRRNPDGVAGLSAP